MNERDIFLAAIEIQDPQERAAYVERACGGDAGMRSGVVRLLHAHAETSRFLETPVAAADAVVDLSIHSESGHLHEEGDHIIASAEAEFSRFLQPANRPGWLGRLGHYEIEAILGRGAFGIVAKAFDEKLLRVVAIKLLSPELATTSPPRKRFLREARSAAAVQHENIVAIYAVEEEPIPYLVMEYIPGQTLQQRMDEHGPLDVPEVLRIGQQVAAGLAAAHAAKLIHRDIKPSNILLTGAPNERAKISDFGLARAVDDASLTSSGLIAGTPMYMAPEQARGEMLDPRADLFSLGSVLYHMVSGRPPFRAVNTVAVLKRVCEDTPRPIADIIPETPDWLSRIIFRLLEKHPDDRFQSAEELADLLERCANEFREDCRIHLPSAETVPSGDNSGESVTRWSDAVNGIIWGVASGLGAIAGLYWLWIFLAIWWQPWKAGPPSEVTARTDTHASATDVAGGLEEATARTPDVNGASLQSKIPLWLDLLQTSEVSRFAARPDDGVELVNGTLQLECPGKGNLAQIWFESRRFKNARMRLVVESADHERQGALEFGWDNEHHWPRRLSFVIHNPDDRQPVATFWRLDEGFRTTDLWLQQRLDIDWTKPIPIVCELRNGQVSAWIGNLELKSTHRLDPTQPVIPFLGGVDSRWRVLEWQILDLDAA